MTTDHEAAVQLAPDAPLQAHPTRSRIALGWPALHDRAWLWFTAGLLVLLLGFLIGPRVATDAQNYQCVGNVDLPGPFGIGLNCDSPQFTWLARQPAGLLEHQNARQSRPGMIVAAALLTRPLSLVVAPGGPPLPVPQGLADTERITSAFMRDLPAYLAYILLNAGILLLCFHVLRQVIAPAGETDGARIVILVAVGLLLVGNDVTKAFFWSPHTQLLNVLVPVLALAATLRVLAGAAFERRFAVGLGLAVGFGLTAYGVFIVVVACIAPPWLWALSREASRPRRRHGIANLALLLALTAAPMAIWYAYVVHTTGAFFHVEAAQFGQVVWILEALAQGDFLRRFFITLWQLLVFAAPQAVPLALLIFLLALAAWDDRRAAAGLRAAFPVGLVGLYVSAAFLTFYTCVGWFSPRLAYPAIPSLLIAAGVAAAAMADRMDARRRGMLAFGCSGLALANLVWVIVKDGPWS